MKIERFSRKKDQPKAPNVIINQEAFSKLHAYIQAKSEEITLFGIVEENENRSLYEIIDFIIPPQTENSSTFTTTNDDKYAKWLHELERDTRKKMLCHIHTHPNMSTSPSGTDESTIKDKVENLSNFYIRMIINKKMEFRTDFFDLKEGWLFKELPIFLILDNYIIKYDTSGPQITPPKYENAEKELDEKIEKKPITPTTTSTTPSTGDYRGSYYGGTYYGSKTYHSTPQQKNTNKKKEKNLEHIQNRHQKELPLRTYKHLVNTLNEFILIQDYKNPYNPKISYKDFKEEHPNEENLLNAKYHNDILEMHQMSSDEWKELPLDAKFEILDDYLALMEEI